jgi:CHAT domain-containing protein
MARIHAETGEAELALRYANRALEKARGGKAAVVWSTAHAVSAVRLRLGLREEALSALEESIEAIERLRAGVSPSDDAKTGFFDSKQEVYADAIALLTELGRSEEALEVAERGRARAFLDLLGSGTSEGEAYPGSGRPEPASRETLRAVTLEEIREETRRRKTAVLEYFCTKDRLFIWLVQPDGTVHSAVSRIGRHDLARLIEQMRHTIPGARARDGLEQLERGEEPSASALEAPDPRPALRRLWQVAIHPVSRWLPGNPEHTVTIVPHGPLFLVSFAALMDEAGRYLIERHTFHYAPSVAVLSRTRGRHRFVPPEKLTLLVVGNPRMPHLPGRRKALAPLPGAEFEAREVAALFPASRVRTLTGQEARESLVRRLAPDRTILHFATHGVVFDDEPLESLIALAPERAQPEEAAPSRAIFRGGTAGRLPAISDRDGLWTAREVFPMALRAELVTLSACNTALGRISGDGVAGLSRAFLAAGTPSVLASLWRVADVAGRFQMERFYRALRSNGGNKAAALRQAQLETLRSLRAKELRIPSGKPLPDQPIFWAPFVLIGEPL